MKRSFLVFVLIITWISILMSNDLSLNSQNIKSLSLSELMNMKVKISTLSEISYKKVPSSIKVFTKKEIENNNWYYLYDLLSSIDGFISGETGLFTCPTVRGIPDNGTGNKLILLIDGVPFNFLLFNGGFLDFPLDTAQKVEVMIGPSSPLYGADAYQGVINIITKKTTLYYSKISTSAGSNNSYINNIEFNNSIGKFNYFLNLNGIRSQGFDIESRKAYPDKKFVTNKSNFKNMRSAFLKWDIGNLSGHFIYYDHYQGYGTYLYSTEKSVTRLKSYNLPLKYRKKIGKILYENKTYLNYDKLVEDDTKWAIPNTPLLYMNSENYLFGSDNIFRFNLPARINTITGLKYEYSQIRDVSRMPDEPPITFQDAHIYNNFSLYCQFEKNFNEYLYAISGIRYNSSSQYSSVLNPRGGLVFSFSDFLFIKTLYGEAYRSPKEYEIYSSLGNVMEASNELESERLKTMEFSIQNKWTDYLGTEVIFYKNWMTDMIANVAINDSINQFQNVSKAQSVGMKSKLTLNKYPLKMEISYSYNESTDEDDEPLPNTNNHSLISTISYYLDKNISFTAKEYYYDDFYVFETNPYYPKLSGFYRLDLAMRYSNFIWTNLDLSLNIENIMDEDYGYPGVRGGNGAFPGRHPGASRNFMIKLSHLL